VQKKEKYIKRRHRTQILLAAQKTKGARKKVTKRTNCGTGVKVEVKVGVKVKVLYEGLFAQVIDTLNRRGDRQ